MFDQQYLIQVGCLMAVFLLWFVVSVPYRLTHLCGGDSNATEENFDSHSASSNEEGHKKHKHQHHLRGCWTIIKEATSDAYRHVFDGLLLMGLSIIFNILGNGIILAGDILTVVSMCSLFLCTTLYIVRLAFIAHFFWFVFMLSNFAMFVVPFASFRYASVNGFGPLGPVYSRFFNAN